MGSGFSLQAAFWCQNAMLALFLRSKKSLRCSPSPESCRKKFQFFLSYQTWNSAFPYIRFHSRYISRYVNLKFRFLPFVVASIVVMVFFSAVFAARAPAMGNSTDRAWQFSQLMKGVLTAFNPSHGSLSYVQAGHCVSKQVGRHDAACQGCPRCVFLARRKLAASGSSRAPCAFPNLRCDPRCWLFSCLGFEFPTPLFP